MHSLKAAILARYKSVHAFCKAHPELKRGVVYQTISGRYAGNRELQADKIRQALNQNTDCGIQTPQTLMASRPISREQLAHLLENIRCSNCRRLNRRECMACRAQTAMEAAQLFDRIYSED